MDLTQFKVRGVPPTVYYIPNFITEIEESFLLKNIYSVPKPKWTYLSNRRLQVYGGIPHAKGMVQEKIPTWLQTFMHKVDNLHIFDGKKTNQVLINEYLPGQGIMPHSDGPLFSPTIATITCGSHTVLEFMENEEKRVNVCSILLERCSLVIIKEDMYFKYLHSISEKEVDNIGGCANTISCSSDNSADELEMKRTTRVSITIRNVPKVFKIKFW